MFLFEVYVPIDSSVYVLRIHFVGECVNAPWWMVCSSKEMVIPLVKVKLYAVAFLCIKIN